MDALNEVVKKFGLRGAAFVATDSEGMFGLAVGGDVVTPVGLWETALNVGRLWRHMRESVRLQLNTFDGTGWNAPVQKGGRDK